jgi:Na+/melibiose symporter-like transporter
MLVSMFFFPKLIKRFSVVTVFSLGAVMGIAGYGINFFAGSNMVLLGAGFMLSSFANLPFAYLLGPITMDCASYNEWKGNRRLEGSMGAVNGFTNKVGSAVGTAALGMLLGAAGYDGALEIQTSSVIWMIRLLYSLIPVLIYALLFIIVCFFNLEKLMPQIEKENAERRAQAAAISTGSKTNINDGGVK